MPLSPPSLPPYIFLMSDHTTAKLANEVAEALSAKYPSVYVDDFLAPIHEAYRALFSLDWKRDMASDVESTERDHIVSLEKWFIEQFGEHELGKLARERCDERNEMADYITVFRDATPYHLTGLSLVHSCLTIELSKFPDAASVLSFIER